MPWTKVPIKFQEPLDSGSGCRTLSYKEAIREALDQALESDPRVFLFGEGIDDVGGVFGSTRDLHKIHGLDRVSDTPLSEQALTGIGIGAATLGMRPVLIHMRCDFLPLTLDQLCNHAAKWRYMTGGRASSPIVVRAIVGRGWGSAAQHSQSLASILAHFPGLTILLPATPYDAKGMLLSAIAGNDPAIMIEHRWLFEKKGPVPEGKYLSPPGRSIVVRGGKDLTIVSSSMMLYEALCAAEGLAKRGRSAEVIDIRSLRPLDVDSIVHSVSRTGRLVVADGAWGFCGASAEIIAAVVERAFDMLKAPPLRVVFPDCPTPSGESLEKMYYPGSAEIEEACLRNF